MSGQSWHPWLYVDTTKIVKFDVLCKFARHSLNVCDTTSPTTGRLWRCMHAKEDMAAECCVSGGSVIALIIAARNRQSLCSC